MIRRRELARLLRFYNLPVEGDLVDKRFRLEAMIGKL